MARKRPFLDFLKNTIQQAQTSNRDNPNEETANSNIFDMIKDKINDGRKQGGGGSLIDVIKNKVDDARSANDQDPDQKNAPGSIFDMIKDKVEDFRNQGHQNDFENLLDEFDIEEQNIAPAQLQQIKQQFMVDRQQLRNTYAQKLRDLD